MTQVADTTANRCLALLVGHGAPVTVREWWHLVVAHGVSRAGYRRAVRVLVLGGWVTAAVGAGGAVRYGPTGASVGSHLLSSG